MYTILSEIPSASISSLDMVKPPHQLLITDNINGISIDRPVAGLFDYAAIQSFVHQNLRDALLAKENSALAVYNATNTAGLATKEAKVLKGLGYRVKTIANSPNITNPSTTILVDLTGGKAPSTKHYLEERFKVKAKDSMPDEFGIGVPLNTEFVIILGTDTK